MVTTASRRAARRRSAVAAVLAVMLVATACSDDGGDTTQPTAITTSTTSTTSTIPPDADEGLFTESDLPIPEYPRAARIRAVTVDLDLLLDGRGRPREIETFSANLFPDVVYTAVITEVRREGDGYSWVGYLDGIEVSSVTLVYTAGVFIGQFASPEGVFEVSTVGDGLYRVVEIDQAQMPGELSPPGEA